MGIVSYNHAGYFRWRHKRLEWNHKRREATGLYSVVSANISGGIVNSGIISGGKVTGFCLCFKVTDLGASQTKVVAP